MSRGKCHSWKETALTGGAWVFLSVSAFPESPGIAQKAAQAQAPPGGVLLAVSVPGTLEHSPVS